MTGRVFKSVLSLRKLGLNFVTIEKNYRTILSTAIVPLSSSYWERECRNFHNSSSMKALFAEDNNKHGDDDDAQTSISSSFQFIPEPTWSIKDLKLTAEDGDDENVEITDDELETLARRCLIDIRGLPTEKREKLKVELANIMRCTSLVCNIDLDDDTIITGIDNKNISAEEMYDFPRFGVGHPNYAAGLQNEDIDQWDQEKKEANQIMHSMEKQGKLVTKDGDKYFSIATTKS